MRSVLLLTIAIAAACGCCTATPQMSPKQQTAQQQAPVSNPRPQVQGGPSEGAGGPTSWMEGVVVGLIPLILAALVTQIARWRDNERFRKKVRSKNLEGEPGLYIFPTLIWSNDAEASEVAQAELTEDALWKHVTGFLKSRETNLLVVTGQWGTGKTAMAKKLVAHFSAAHSKVSRLPVYLDASKFKTGRVLAEAVDQLVLVDEIQVDVSHFQKWFLAGRLLLVLDALDQLPFSFADRGVLSDIQRFAEGLSPKREAASKIVMMVRKEFYDGNSAFRKFITGRRGCVLHVTGLAHDYQIRSYLEQSDPRHGGERGTAVLQAMENDPILRSMFRVPEILRRVSSMDFQRVQSMASAGATLSGIYRDSFRDIPPSVLNLCEELAYDMYLVDIFHVEVTPEVLASYRCSTEELESARQAGILVRKIDNQHEFEHASMRDYFAAQKIVAAVRGGQGEAVLARRPIHYLVSEFASGLIDSGSEVAFVQLLESTEIDLVRNNCLDILAESDSSTLKDVVRTLVESRLASGHAGADAEMSEADIFLAIIAGVVNLRAPVERLLKYIRAAGVETFLSRCFITKDHFRYYEGREDCARTEWFKLIRSKRYNYCRMWPMVVLAELKVADAVPHLRAVANDGDEDMVIRKCAKSAHDKLTRL